MADGTKPEPQDEIDVTNWCLVHALDPGLIRVGLLPRGGLTRAQALSLAAWLVAIAEPMPGGMNTFKDYLDAVRQT